MWVKYLFRCVLSIISCWNLMLGVIKWVKISHSSNGFSKNYMLWSSGLFCPMSKYNVMFLNQIQSSSKWCEVYKYVACFVCKSNALTHWWLLSCIFIIIYLVYISRPYLCERRSVGDQYLIFDNTFSVTFIFFGKSTKEARCANICQLHSTLF